MKLRGSGRKIWQGYEKRLRLERRSLYCSIFGELPFVGLPFALCLNVARIPLTHPIRREVFHMAKYETISKHLIQLWIKVQRDV